VGEGCDGETPGRGVGGRNALSVEVFVEGFEGFERDFWVGGCRGGRGE
jgi:hypothetical protein